VLTVDCVHRLLADEGSYLSFGGKDGAPAPNAYEVLGVGPGVEAAAARRQFMKLSLWVHPDKNAHPRAVDAFHAADMAFKAIRVRPTPPISLITHCAHSTPAVFAISRPTAELRSTPLYAEG
jgi:DnaJ domain